MKIETLAGGASARIRAICTAVLLLAGLPSCAGSEAPATPPEVSCTGSVAESGSQASLASAALSLATRETWSVRFQQSDHGARQALRSVYAAADGPLWLAHGHPTRQALALLSILQGAQEYGLQPTDYDAARLAAVAAGMSG